MVVGGDWRGGRRLMEGWRPIGCGKEGCGARLDGEGRLEGRGVRRKVNKRETEGGG